MPSFFRNARESASYSVRGEEKPGTLLLAEGDAEALFLEKWLSLERASPARVAVVCFRGQTKLPLVFKSLSEGENFEKIQNFGFFLDAEDGDATQKAGAIAKVLVDHEVLPKGTKLKPGGAVASNKGTIALFVSPDNAGAGFIEQIVLQEIVGGPFARCITRFQECLRDMGNEPHAKTLVQAYLGAHTPGLCGTGRGFQAGALDVRHNVYGAIRKAFAPML